MTSMYVDSTDMTTRATMSQHEAILGVIDSHDVIVDGYRERLDTRCLVSVCTTCGSIVMAATEYDAEMHRTHTDTTCHEFTTWVKKAPQV